jgi:hypothetical protein
MMSVTVRFFDDGKQEAVVMKHSSPKILFRSSIL